MAAEGPLVVVLEMVSVLLQNTLGTMTSMLGLSGDLFSSLGLVYSAGGVLGLGIIAVILVAAGFFLAKFFLGSMKTVGILMLLGIVLVVFFILGMSLI